MPTGKAGRGQYAIAVIIVLVAAASACNFPPPATAPDLSPTHSASSVATAVVSALAPPSQTPTGSVSESDQLASELADFGVSIADSQLIQRGDLQVVLDAVTTLAERISIPLSEAGPSTREPEEAFRQVFGLTLIRLYPDRETVDGIHYGINCGRSEERR